MSAVDVVAARADLVDCAFRDNYMGGPDEGIVQGINNASIALHRPSFSGNSGDGHLLHFDPHQDGRAGWAEGVENRVKYFSDDPAIVDYCQNRNGLQPMQPLAMSDTNFVFMQSWLERKQEVQTVSLVACASHTHCLCVDPYISPHGFLLFRVNSV